MKPSHFFRVYVTVDYPKRKRTVHEIQSYTRKDAIACALDTTEGDVCKVEVESLRSATDAEMEDFDRLMRPGFAS